MTQRRKGIWSRLRSTLFGDPVTIEALEVVPYALPFREPYVTARGTLSKRELVLVRLRSSAGTGLGEAVSMSLRGGPGIGRIVEELTRCREALEGARLGFPPDHLDECVAAGAGEQTIGAIELAFFDLSAKLAGIPVWRLLTDQFEGQGPKAVACNATLSAEEPSRLAAQATEWADRGFRTFKVKVGTPHDMARIAAVRDAVGDEAKIRIDANGVWDEAQAIEMLRDLEPLDIELAEQPVATLESMVRVREATNVPLAADESVNTPDDARRAVLLGSCELATVKLAKVGRLHTAFDIAHELSVYLSSALDGPVGIAAAAHVAQALPRAGIASSLAQGLATSELFSDTIASRECEVANGELRLSDGPGFGIEISEVELARRRL